MRRTTRPDDVEALLSRPVCRPLDAMHATLAELAKSFGCELHGQPDVVVETVGTLSGAGTNAVSFVANPHYRSALGRTHAAAVILEGELQSDCPVAALVTPNPYATYARIAAFLHPSPTMSPGIHPTAIIASSAVVPPSAQTGPHVIIGDDTELGESVVVGPGSVVGANVRVGAATRLVARVTVMDDIRIGARCVLHPGAVIGAGGFGFARDHSAWVKVPQLGSVEIGNDVEIGANTAIDRGTIEDTVVEDGVKLDNLCQIGHNVHVGAHTVMAALCGVSGSTRIGKRCVFAAGTGLVGHINICDDVRVTFHSTVTRSIRVAGKYSGTLPADEANRWRRNAARFKKLDKLAVQRRDVADASVDESGGPTGKADIEE